MPSTILGFNKQSLAFSFILLCYTSSFATNFYGVLPQRVIHYTCLEQQQQNSTTTCDSKTVSDISTRRIAYLNIAFSGACFLTNGPLSRYADITSNRKGILLYIIAGLTFDQVTQYFSTSYLQMVIFHAVSGCMGNLYITLALLFSFIADASNTMSNSTPEEKTMQRRKDYGLAEGSIYVGVMLGPALGGIIFKVTKSFTIPYLASSGLSIVLFLSVLIFLPKDASSRDTTNALSNSLLRDVVVDPQPEEEQEKETDSDPTVAWWNPFSPFILLFCRKERLIWSSVLLMAWLGQKGIQFVYNPFIHYQYHSGAFLIGIVAIVKSLSSVFSNLFCMRIFSQCKMKGETIILIGCSLLIGAYCLIGFGGSNKPGSETPPSSFWIGVSLTGLAAFLSPILRSLMTGTVNKKEKTVNAVTLLGGIAAIESFCDFAVPFIYGFGFWDYLVTLGKPAYVFLGGVFFYFLAGATVVICGRGKVAVTRSSST